MSGQLDVDRLDYLRRDSFYTGVSEGIVGAERIIKLINVNDNELVVEEKGIYSVEKLLIARRLMYWQVYLHKTVISTEFLILNILRRVKELAEEGRELFAGRALRYFLDRKEPIEDPDEIIPMFSKSTMPTFPPALRSGPRTRTPCWRNSAAVSWTAACSKFC